MMTPSVDGMRFLPLALLMLAIFRGEAVERPILGLGYALWLFGLAWSPEAGAYTTIVWFPYLALRAAQKERSGSPGAIAGVAFCGAAMAVVAPAVGFAILTLAFRARFGDRPSVSGFLTYMRNPPGILPPNPLGPIWLIAPPLVGIGAIALTRADPRALRTGAVSLLGLVAVISYYLGRSHDNNVINLFPIVVLLTASVLSVALPPFLDGFSKMVLVGIAAWPMAFGLQSWALAAQSGEAIALGPARMLNRFQLPEPDAWALLDACLVGLPGRHAAAADAGAALAWLTEQGAGPPLVINQGLILPRNSVGVEWTGVNNLANFDLLPREFVARFIQSGAVSFHRQGWLVDREQPGDWLALFRSAYEVAGERAFGGYTASG
jgi:hypothetical protein